MNKNIIFLFVIYLLANNCLGQLLLKDEYAEIGLKLLKYTTKETSIEELEKYFDPSLRTDSLRKELSIFKSEVIKYQDRAEHYLVKMNDTFPNMVYNINIHNPKKKEIFGDLRLMFKDNTDYLIDGWIYFPSRDEPKIDKSDFEGISPITKSVPPPPPSPPLPK